MNNSFITELVIANQLAQSGLNSCECWHVDGHFGASVPLSLLDWKEHKKESKEFNAKRNSIIVSLVSLVLLPDLAEQSVPLLCYRKM